MMQAIDLKGFAPWLQAWTDACAEFRKRGKSADSVDAYLVRLGHETKSSKIPAQVHDALMGEMRQIAKAAFAKRKTVTKVTRHDEKGRILEFVKEEVG